jgi:hypothetical protein
MDIHEQFSQSRSSKISSLHHQQVEDIEKKEHFGLRPGHTAKTRQEQQQQDGVISEKVGATAAPAPALETLDHPLDLELDESERQAMEQFEAEHPGWARFDVDIVIKTVVYAGEISSFCSLSLSPLVSPCCCRDGTNLTLFCYILCRHWMVGGGQHSNHV